MNYTGPEKGVIHIEQQYNNGYCTTRYNFDNGSLETMCERFY